MTRAVAASACVLAAAAAAFTASPAASAAPERKFVVVREHSAGTASRAQPYLDQLLAVVGKQNQWPNVSGRYFAEREPALDFIAKEKPDFGIFSLSAFLSLKSTLSLDVVGEVLAPKAGGKQYFLLSKSAHDLEGCKAHKLSTVLGSDAKFVDRVVARGAFKLADMTLVEARRPLEPLKQVLRGEADCALVDDAQVEASHHIEQGDELKPVWHSAELPGMAVVAFPRADAAAVAAFKKTLAGLCSAAREACATVGIDSLKPAGDDRYRAALDAYSK
ncbi:MAG TPA: PhnD/SsuA/transferrin family substrate-binding protein [Polyangiaceae bacterium]|jgi:ABC-type amino acid transport substrate-binding protein|nr:PhnD/SsuA/transferrin family substrate-binding protein [Polyangiaceae bacterium]